jgi:phosphotransferase system HPr (HPr) family protein
VDLHARPAGAFAKAAAGFGSAITLAHGEKEVDGRSVLSVMSLGATAGSEVVVKASGDDAQEAVTALGDLLAAVSA